jgi:hypothetical protein
MDQHFQALEQFTELEPEIIKTTKIHKVLKAIIKISSIPKDEEYKFKDRSNALLSHWNKALAADVETSGGADIDEPKTNGVGHDEKVNGSKSPAVDATKEDPEPSTAAVDADHAKTVPSVEPSESKESTKPIEDTPEVAASA